MKKIISIFISLLMVTSLWARYEVVDNALEFRKVLDEYDFVFVAFVNLMSNEGHQIKDRVRVLALKGDFGGTLRDRFAFVVIPAQKEKFARIARKYEYKDQPHFALFEFDQLVTSSNLDGDFSIYNMEKFIMDAVEESLNDLKQDIENEKEAERRGEHYRPYPRFQVGIRSGFNPGYGYYRFGRPYWWYHRYYRYPYRHYPHSTLYVDFGY